MLFSENPLSLSVSEPAFQAWLVSPPAENGNQSRVRSRNPDRFSDLRTRSSAPSSSWQLYVPFLNTVLNFVTESWNLIQSLPFPDPRISQQDLLKPPVPWTAGFCDSCEGLAAAYSLPSSWEEGVVRVEKNAELYIGNYLRLAGVILLCILYLRPLSLIGLLLIALASHFSLGLALGNGVSVLGFHISSGGFLLRALRVGIQIGVFVAMFYCQVLPTLLRAGLMSFAGFDV